MEHGKPGTGKLPSGANLPPVVSVPLNLRASLNSLMSEIGVTQPVCPGIGPP